MSLYIDGFTNLGKTTYLNELVKEGLLKPEEIYHYSVSEDHRYDGVTRIMDKRDFLLLSFEWLVDKTRMLSELDLSKYKIIDRSIINSIVEYMINYLINFHYVRGLFKDDEDILTTLEWNIYHDTDYDSIVDNLSKCLLEITPVKLRTIRSVCIESPLYPMEIYNRSIITADKRYSNHCYYAIYISERLGNKNLMNFDKMRRVYNYLYDRLTSDSQTSMIVTLINNDNKDIIKQLI